MSEQPKEPAAGPTQQSELTAQEKRAYAHRANAFQELAGVEGKLLAETLRTIEVPAMGADGKTPIKIIVPHNPLDMMLLISAQAHRIEQLEIGFQCIVDMLLQTKIAEIHPAEGTQEQLVKTTRDPALEAGAQPFLKAAGYDLQPSRITMEQFWLMCARAAEAKLSVIRRGLLSQNVGSILKS